MIIYQLNNHNIYSTIYLWLRVSLRAHLDGHWHPSYMLSHFFSASTSTLEQPADRILELDVDAGAAWTQPYGKIWNACRSGCTASNGDNPCVSVSVYLLLYGCQILTCSCIHAATVFAFASMGCLLEALRWKKSGSTRRKDANACLMKYLSIGLYYASQWYIIM